jgi:hypothetical protein
MRPLPAATSASRGRGATARACLVESVLGATVQPLHARITHRFSLGLLLMRRCSRALGDIHRGGGGGGGTGSGSAKPPPRPGGGRLAWSKVAGSASRIPFHFRCEILNPERKSATSVRVNPPPAATLARASRPQFHRRVPSAWAGHVRRRRPLALEGERAQIQPS